MIPRPDLIERYYDADVFVFHRSGTRVSVFRPLKQWLREYLLSQAAQAR